LASVWSSRDPYAILSSGGIPSLIPTAHAIVVVVVLAVVAGVEPEAQAEPARFQVEVDPRRSRNRQTQILQTKHSVSHIAHTKIKKSNSPS
jgi:hypothetical protein